MPPKKDLITHSEAQTMQDPPERVRIDPDTRRRLAAARENPGLGPIALFRRIQNVPEGLHFKMVENWLYGASKAARFDHLQYVLREWEAQPPVLYVSDTLRRHLRMLRASTGIGPHALLRGTSQERPDGLIAETIKRWINDKAVTARKEHLDFVLSKWEGLLDEGRDRTYLDEETRTELAGHRRRTGVGPGRLLEGCAGTPKGLNGYMVAHWLTGRTKTARRDHLDFVMRRWEQLPDSRTSAAWEWPGSVGRRAPEGGCVPLTRETVEALRRLRDASKMAAGRFMAKAENPPPGLSASTISGWLYGNAATARKEHLDFVLARCREIWGEACEVSPQTLSLAPMEVICLQTEAFYALVEQVVARVVEKHGAKPDKWVGPEEAMRILRIKAKSTLQTLRDEGKIRYSHPQKRIILYDRDSLLAYLEKNARETF